MKSFPAADLILINGRFRRLDRENPVADAVGVRDGRFVEVGDERDVMRRVGAQTHAIDLRCHPVMPGLNDSHLHLIRGGLNYNLESRWDGLPLLADALRMLEAQADRTPTPQRVRVVGGWGEFQFAALCGVSPVPASSGKVSQHRLNRGGDRAANSALHIIAIGRL